MASYNGATDSGYAALSDGANHALNASARSTSPYLSHHSSILEYAQVDSGQKSRPLGRASAGSERSHEVESLQEAVHDLHERSLLCVGKLEAVMVPLRDNGHQESPRSLVDRPTNVSLDDIDDSVSRGSRDSSMDASGNAFTKRQFHESMTSAASSMPDFAVVDDVRFNEAVSLHLVRFHNLSADQGGPGMNSGNPFAAEDSGSAQDESDTSRGQMADEVQSPTGAASGADEHQVVKRRDLDDFLQALPRDMMTSSGNGLCWLHVNHAESLRLLATHLQCHPLMLKTFFDSRPQTMMNHLDFNTVLLTSVAVFLEAAELHTHKLCIYATPHVVITFELELLTRSRAYQDTELSTDKVFLEVQRALVLDDHGCAAVFKGSSVATNGENRTFAENNDTNKGHRDTSEAAPTSALRKMLDELGGGFLAYLLLMEMSVLGQSTLHHYAEAIRALHHQVHNKFSARRGVNYFRSINILHHGIEILSAHYEQAMSLGMRSLDPGGYSNYLGNDDVDGGAGFDSPFGEWGEEDDRHDRHDSFGDADYGEIGFSGGGDFLGSFGLGGHSERHSRSEEGNMRSGWVDEQRRKHSANNSTFGHGGLTGRVNSEAQGDNLTSGGGGNFGQHSLDKYAIYSHCITATHLPFYRDVEDMASAGLRKLAGHEAALGELRTTLRDQVHFFLVYSFCYVRN